MIKLFLALAASLAPAAAAAPFHEALFPERPLDRVSVEAGRVQPGCGELLPVAAIVEPFQSIDASPLDWRPLEEGPLGRDHRLLRWTDPRHVVRGYGPRAVAADDDPRGRAAWTDGDGLVLAEAASGRAAFLEASGSVRAVALSPSGDTLAFAVEKGPWDEVTVLRPGLAATLKTVVARYARLALADDDTLYALELEDGGEPVLARRSLSSGEAQRVRLTSYMPAMAMGLEAGPGGAVAVTGRNRANSPVEISVIDGFDGRSARRSSLYIDGLDILTALRFAPGGLSLYAGHHSGRVMRIPLSDPEKAVKTETGESVLDLARDPREGDLLVANRNHITVIEGGLYTKKPGTTYAGRRAWPRGVTAAALPARLEHAVFARPLHFGYEAGLIAPARSLQPILDAPAAQAAVSGFGAKRREIMDKLGVFRAEDLIPALRSLLPRGDNFSTAARKWLGELAALGDEEAGSKP